jgi:monoterpene epsilon-lactone hydrolase
MAEIDAIRALLGSKPRPVGWGERRARLDEVGSIWPVADDVALEAVDIDGVPGEFSIVPGSDLRDSCCSSTVAATVPARLSVIVVW